MFQMSGCAVPRVHRLSMKLSGVEYTSCHREEMKMGFVGSIYLLMKVTQLEWEETFFLVLFLCVQDGGMMTVAASTIPAYSDVAHRSFHPPATHVQHEIL